MERSENIDKIATALVKFQALLEPLAREAQNEDIGNKYASLVAMQKAVQPHLKTCGLGVMQLPTMSVSGEKPSLETVILHESGQYISSALDINPVHNDEANDMQAFGIAVTYLSRYCFKSALNIPVADATDTDGVGAGSMSCGGANKDSSPPVDKTKQQAESSSPAIHKQGPPKITGIKYVKEGELLVARGDVFGKKRLLVAAGFKESNGKFSIAA